MTANLDELAPSHITFAKGLIAGGANLTIGLVLGGAAVAWTVFGDPMSGRELVSLLIAAAGVSFVLRSEHSHVHVPDLHHRHTHVDS